MISAALSATDVTKREESAALRDSSPVVAICSSIALATAANTGRIAAIAVMIRFDRRDQFLRVALQLVDLAADFLGGVLGRGRERLDLARHHRKAAARIACAHRLDGGVEREQIGLLGDRRDQAHHVADLRR